MGRTIKVSELKRWDVFKFSTDELYICTAKYDLSYEYTAFNKIDSGDSFNMQLEVELLGQMQFIPTELPKTEELTEIKNQRLYDDLQDWADHSLR
jgi:hypothetical protein